MWCPVSNKHRMESDYVSDPPENDDNKAYFKILAKLFGKTNKREFSTQTLLSFVSRPILEE